MPGGMPYGGGCFPITGNADFLFAFPTRGGDAVYITLEQLCLIAGFILALLSYIDRKKK